MNSTDFLTYTSKACSWSVDTATFIRNLDVHGSEFSDSHLGRFTPGAIRLFRLNCLLCGFDPQTAVKDKQ